MEGLNFEEIFEMELPKGRANRSKPAKRKWREIEAIKDRQRLQKELMDLGIGSEELEKLEY